ncbi:dethiobiotin synthase [Fastidiosibacter lacustris]|uniref:dethiobiotin synthase n=1 Tax=Fastidiosibacter lacustris TaxID=2056695 RepID=UPI001300BA90|nr:dethiobiotin synthase [Fastidiosibacter lacustris]
MSLELLLTYNKIGVIGTDTEVGKTYVSIHLMTQIKQMGKNVAGLKPIASGAFLQDGKWVNGDALLLQQTASKSYDYELVNPNLYKPPIAPHIAAKDVSDELSVEKLMMQSYDAFGQIDADLLLIEGVGGLLTPLNLNQTWADYLKALNIPVILVVGMKLGCINHALLTDYYLRQNEIHCIGWVANCIQADMPRLQENIATLTYMLSVPKILTVDFHIK